jgi:hypothetical protein
MNKIQDELDKKLEELNLLSKKYDNLKNRMFALQKEMSETDDMKIKVQHEIHNIYIKNALK